MSSERGESEVPAVFYLIKKILIIARVMAGWRSALMCDSIARVIFNHDFLKILIFELPNLSSSTFFEQSTLYLDFGSYTLRAI
jgi:hypothetical protein